MSGAPSQPRVGIGLAITCGGQVLLGLRQGSHGAGTWAFPGGHLEFGETPEACALRELLEETGLRPISPFRHTGTTHDWMPAEGKHYVTLILEAAVAPNAQPQRLEPHKCAGWRWCDWPTQGGPGALPQPLFGPLASLIAQGWHPGSHGERASLQAGAGQPAPPVGRVVALARDAEHRFSKPLATELVLIEGLGVQGDAHAGTTVQHRSRVAQDPTQPNLRQVHLLPAELLDALCAHGHAVAPGQLGENITTRGLQLIHLPTDTVLHLGETAEVRLTGLRNPCAQIEAFQPGLLARVLGRDAQGAIERRAGVMGVVLRGGRVVPGDAVRVEWPVGEWRGMGRV